ncbi:MAG: hypothetical protein IMF19_12085 [Proteobacteria bacterium]|nr:hypothetical protein [Pseudomonadota bacterium]
MNATSAETVHTGVSSAKTEDKITKKRIWTDSEMRMIEDTTINREKAFDVDALTRLIVSVQTYTILGKPKITSKDDNMHKQLILNITQKLKDLDLISRLRASMPNLKKHGSVFFQKRYLEGTTAETEVRPITSLQKLEYVEKYENPMNADEYYLFQNVKISKDWQNPLSTLTAAQKVWFIKGGLAEAAKYMHISLKKDIVVDLADIIEIKNNESGESSLTACLSEIFIKHLIFMHFPNLVALVVSPNTMFTHSTKEEDGIPQPPSSQMEESNPTEFTRSNNAYTAFKKNMQDMLNNLVADWNNKGVVSKPDTIKAEIMESAQALNPVMLNTMLDRLNREIAFALTFPLSLLDAQGAELSTSRNILTTMSIVMKGIQDQYVTLVQDIINNQFPEAEDAGIAFSFSELDPRDAKDLADMEKLHADIIKIFYEFGASEDDIKALSSKYDLLQEPTLGSEGIVKSQAVNLDEYSEADMALAGRSIAQIMEDSEEDPEHI